MAVVVIGPGVVACVSCNTLGHAHEMVRNEAGELCCWDCRGALLAFLVRHHERLDDCHNDIVACEMCRWIKRLGKAALEV